VVIGAVLVVAGVFLLVRGWSYTSEQRVLQLGDLTATVEERRAVRPWIGGVAIVAGALLVVGDRWRGILRRRPSRARRESNRWLLRQCANVNGRVLSIGSGADGDGEGRTYRDYFSRASSYTTSEVTPDFHTDLVLDVRSMPEIEDETYDCVFCSGVLEHVDNYHHGLTEITRILKGGGVLLLGLPFRQAIHGAPNDFWRFTEYGIRHLLANSYEVGDVAAIDAAVRGFPASYWVKARKRA
jgi:SAM-dependent methyltransferase